MQAMDRYLPARRLWTGVLLGLIVVTPASRGQLPPTTPAPDGKALVGNVTVAGNSLIPAQRILNNIKTRSGTVYSQETVNEDVRSLYAMGSFADVKPKTTFQPDGRVTVEFMVLERSGRIEDIIFNGAKHLKKDELSKLTELKKGEILSPWKNQEAVRRILEKYHEQGRPLSTVRLLEGDKPTDTRVVFDITEGPISRVRHISFTGCHFVGQERIRTQIKSSRSFLGLIGGKYNPDMVKHDITELEDYYKSFGFHDVRVSREIQWEGDGQYLDLIFHIQEGPQYRIGARPQVEGVGKELPQEMIEALPRVQANDYFNQAKVDGDKKAIEDFYGRTGRDAHVRTNVFHPVETPGVCQVVYQVEERPPIRVGEIYIVGNEVTRQNVILRQFPNGLLPGQIMSIPDLRVVERKLAQLNIFEMSPENGIRPTVEIIDREGDSLCKDLLVRVQETRTGSLLFGMGVNSDAGMSGSIVLNERNFDITRFPTSFEDFLNGRAFRGAGQELRLEVVPGTVVQRYTATFREPFLFDSPYSLTAGGYYWTRYYDEYHESRLGGRLTLGRKLNDLWTMSGGVRVENVGVSNVAPWEPEDIRSVEGHNFLVGLRAGVTRDSRDSYLRPTEGSILDIGFEQVFGDYTYPLFTIDFNKYWTLYQRPDNSGRHVLAMHNQMSIAGSQTPVYDRYYAGGFRSMRGFEFRGVGPQINGYMVGGDFMLLNSLEYQVPILANDHLFAVAFVDSGTVESSVELRNYRVTAGVGVRFVVPMLGPVPIALDFGFPIVKAEGDREQIFSFWVGFFH
jgi:outer membrane protein assembly complex protein YaeT